MNLLCAESSNDHGMEVCIEQGATFSSSDPNILSNSRVLRSLLDTEDSYTVKCDYLRKVQNDITEDNRKVLTSWMSEVCEEQRCSDIVLPLAVNYMDRFLSRVRITRDKFQLLGTVCLLLSSKVRQFRSFSIDQMVYYSDNSCSAKDIMEWELFVLGQLSWDMSSVTANDFLDHILYRLPLSQEHTVIVKKHAQVFITLCSTEYRFSQWKPSVLASASIAAAADGLTWLQKPWKSLQHLLEMINELTHIETNYLQCCVEKIEELVKLGLSTLQQSEEESRVQTTKYGTSVTSSSSQPITSSTKYIEEDYFQSQPETPTDITDINF